MPGGAGRVFVSVHEMNVKREEMNVKREDGGGMIVMCREISSTKYRAREL